MEPQPTLNYHAPKRRRAARPLLATAECAMVGIVAIIVWVITFEPHGGRELSSVLFPASAAALRHLYEGRPIPPEDWYGGALAQWVLTGLLVDGIRLLWRRRRR